MMFQEQNAEFEFAKLSQNKTKVGGKERSSSTRARRRSRTSGRRRPASPSLPAA